MKNPENKNKDQTKINFTLMFSETDKYLDELCHYIVRQTKTVNDTILKQITRQEVKI